ncbi:hypothetical protein K0M31_000255 [Melipona bicolor]|uniref:Uncharacterized protein n=1 Tax=Melipona bicolor TaxID=60889 RepID=A0AA40GDX3_9HYME|nr:hypothetical protein K0M31_000255 [Melipona bicolor]
MQPRTFCFIAFVFIGYAVFAYPALATPVAVTEAAMSEEQKVLVDCQNSDYRTYIKCLRRHKRQHSLHGEFDHTCWESCIKKCQTDYTSEPCDKKCNHCLKKTRHKVQVITEYENECVHGNCSVPKNGDRLGTTNITTKIDIHNVINNNASGIGGTSSGTMCCPTCNPPIPCLQPQPPQPPQPPQHPQQPCPPHICRPPQPQPQPQLPFQLSLVPQLSLGLGLSLGTGCQWPFQWPCYGQNWTKSVGAIDCSGCTQTYSSFRCDVSCYATQGVQTSNPKPCVSPYCVGDIVFSLIPQPEDWQGL